MNSSSIHRGSVIEPSALFVSLKKNTPTSGGRNRSSLLAETLQHRIAVSRSDDLRVWLLLNVVLLVLLLADVVLFGRSAARLLHSRVVGETFPLFYAEIIECVLLSVVLLNVVVLLLVRSTPYLKTHPLYMTAQQMRLMAVDAKNHLFVRLKAPATAVQKSETKSTFRSSWWLRDFLPSFNLNWLFGLRKPMADSLSFTPFNSPSDLGGRSSEYPSQMWSDGGSAYSPGQSTLSLSPTSPISAHSFLDGVSPTSYYSSPLTESSAAGSHFDGLLARLRRERSTLTPNRKHFIHSQEQLKQFLNEYDRKYSPIPKADSSVMLRRRGVAGGTADDLRRNLSFSALTSTMDGRSYYSAFDNDTAMMDSSLPGGHYRIGHFLPELTTNDSGLLSSSAFLSFHQIDDHCHSLPFDSVDEAQPTSSYDTGRCAVASKSEFPESSTAMTPSMSISGTRKRTTSSGGPTQKSAAFQKAASPAFSDRSSRSTSIERKLNTSLTSSMGGGSAKSDGSGGKRVSLRMSLPVWLRYDLSQDSSDLYCQRVRTWISRTIVKPVSNEITALNRRFETAARPDLRIGHAPLSTLQQIAASKADSFPSLMRVLPYLELAPTQQQYLVRRLEQLAADACLGGYIWNSGGNVPSTDGGASPTRAWSTEQFPTDAQLLWHLVRRYLDSKLPPDPFVGNAFTDIYALTAPDKPNRMQCTNGAFYIYQAASHPPHFQLCSTQSASVSASSQHKPPAETVVRIHADGGSDGAPSVLVDVGGGRNNLLLTLLFFFRHGQLENDGHLGRIRLDEHGLNVLWLFE